MSKEMGLFLFEMWNCWVAMKGQGYVECLVADVAMANPRKRAVHWCRKYLRGAF